jgi:uncharacterized protein YqgC (DUF456 family)
MENKRWGMRLAGASIWAVAALTWGSIAHHLWGLPDFGVVLAVVAIALVVALPFPKAERATSGKISPALLNHKG